MQILSQQPQFACLTFYCTVSYVFYQEIIMIFPIFRPSNATKHKKLFYRTSPMYNVIMTEKINNNESIGVSNRGGKWQMN
jgi:hypothetical protein